MKPFNLKQLKTFIPKVITIAYKYGSKIAVKTCEARKTNCSSSLKLSLPKESAASADLVLLSGEVGLIYLHVSVFRFSREKADLTMHVYLLRKQKQVLANELSSGYFCETLPEQIIPATKTMHR